MWDILYHGLSEVDAKAVQRSVAPPQGLPVRLEYCRTWEAVEALCEREFEFDVMILEAAMPGMPRDQARWIIQQVSAAAITSTATIVSTTTNIMVL